MKKIIIIFLSYILILFNSNVYANQKAKELKIGLLAPFSGDYKKLGDSLLLSIQLALDEINDKKIKIIPRDSGSNDKAKLNKAINQIIDEGASIIIGPMQDNFRGELNKYSEVIFLSLSNREPEIRKNVINIGISLSLIHI